MALSRVCIIIAALIASSPFASADVLHFKADLKGSSEVPPVQSSGKGTIEATYNSDTHILSWEGNYSGLSGPVTAAHIHGPAGPGSNAGVMLWLSANIGQCGNQGCLTVQNAGVPPIVSPFHGSARLRDADAAQLKSGRFYINLHTDAHPIGELRGQLLPQQ